MTCRPLILPACSHCTGRGCPECWFECPRPDCHIAGPNADHEHHDEENE